MTIQELKEYFKSGYGFRKATNMSDSSYCNWMKWGYIPFASQKKIEKITGGELKAVWVDRD